MPDAGGGGGGRLMHVLRGLLPKCHDEAAAFANVDASKFEGLPPGACMEGMSAALQVQVRVHAAVKLGLLFVPRMILAVRKQEATEMGRVLRQDHEEIIKLLKGGALFNCWPYEHILRLSEEAMPVSTSPGDAIIKEGDTSRSGIWLVLRGTGYITRKMREGKGPVTEKIVFRYNAPILFGDYALLTAEYRTASVYVDGHSQCWVLPSSVIIEAIERLEPSLQKKIYDVAFSRREKNICNTPCTPDDLRNSYILKDLTDTECKRVIGFLTPKVVRAGDFVYRKGQRCSALYFMTRGRVEVDEVSVPSTVTTFGEGGFVFNMNRYDVDAKAALHCDFWVLRTRDLRPMLQASRSLESRLFNNAAEHRREVLEPVGAPNSMLTRWERLAGLMMEAAIVGEACTHAFCMDLAMTLRPLVLVPRQGILSAVEECNRLYILDRGRARVHNGQGATLESGDVIGATCVCFHRWLFPVQALTGCELWYADKAGIVALLHQHNLYAPYVAKLRKKFLVHEYLPKAKLLGRRVTPGGKAVPPLLYPCADLPEDMTTAFHFDEHTSEPRPPAPPKLRATPSVDHQSVSKSWVVFTPSVMEKHDTAASLADAILAPHPPLRIQAADGSEALQHALDLIKGPAPYQPTVAAGSSRPRRLQERHATQLRITA